MRTTGAGDAAGDLNGTMDDRTFADITSQMHSVQDGFGFRWPAKFPVARIDQILGRGVEPVRGRCRSTGSDHRRGGLNQLVKIA